MKPDVQRRGTTAYPLARVVIVSLLSVACVWLFWRQRVEGPAQIHRVTFQNFDDYVYYYPTFRYAFEQLRKGDFPFWNPYQHCGTPFFATGQHLLLYPLNFPYLFLPTAEAMKVASLLHLCLAILFTYALARVIELSVPAAFAAGITFAFGPGLLALIYLPHHLYGAIWLPLHLCLVHLVATRRRKLGWALMLGGSLAAQYLGGYPMFTLFSVYAVGGYSTWLLVAGWRNGTPSRDLGHTMLALICAGVLAIALSAPQLFPSIELSRHSARPLGGLTIEDADPNYRHSDLLGLLIQALLPIRNGQFVRPIAHGGVIATLLACLALVHRRKRSIALFFLVFTLVAGLLAFGRHAPLYAIYFHLPGSDLFRRADRFFTPCSLGIAMLTAFGVDWLWRGEKTERAVRTLVVASLLSIGFLGVASLVDGNVWRNVERSLRPAKLSESLELLAWYLAAVTVWALVYLKRPNRRKELVALIPLAIYASLFLTFVNVSTLPEFEPDLNELPGPIVDFLQARQGYARTYFPPQGIFISPIPEPPLPAKSGMLHGIYAVTDRENVYSDRFARFVAPLEDPASLALRRVLQGPGRTTIPQGGFHIDPYSPNLRLLDLLGTEFVLQGPHRQLDKDPDRFEPVYEKEGVRIYRNRRAFPRVYVVHRVETVSPDDVLDRLTDPSFEAHEAVILEEPVPNVPLQAPPGADEARIIRYEPRSVEVEARVGAPGFLVLTDQYYDGWQAAVDGNPTPIYRADYLFRAIRLDAGTHRVKFRFVPRKFYYGVGVALSAISLAVVAMIVRARRASTGMR